MEIEEREELRRLLHRLFNLMDGETTSADIDKQGVEILSEFIKARATPERR